MQEPIPLTTGSEEGIKDTVINDNFRRINDRLIVNEIRDDNGVVRMQVGELPYEGGFGTIYFEEDGTPNMIHGVLPDGTIALVIAREGEDIFDAI